MNEPNGNTFLRAIAEGNDHIGRLVFADWLEERGDGSRAEFIRVQCELASAILPEERRQALRVRERALLDAHRHAWLQAFGLPLEDVCFHGGLVAAARLAQWEDGRLLAAEYAPRLAPLRELDLSGLGIGDAGLASFARAAQFPALRKLILSDNGITDAGAAALAQAAGLPRLDTVYLFRNPVSGGARAALEQAPHFCLGSLDLGERAEGYSMSTGETEIARRQYVRAHVLPLVGTYFRDHGRLQSAMLCVAQYWDDEANDAVHGTLIVSELFEPTLKVVEWGEESDPNVPHTNMKRKYGGRSSVIDLWGLEWDDNGGAIPLWAGFAPEGGHQEYSQLSEVYAPAVIFYRHGGYEFLPMCRPDLDGIRPEWGGDE